MDNSISVPIYIVNFYLEFRRDADESSLLKVLNGSDNIYNNYRVVYNKLLNGKEITNTELEKIYKDNYYWFFIMEELIAKGKFSQLHAKYKDINISNAAMMYHYYNNEYEVECITVDVIERVKYKDKNMLLSKCLVEGENGYYLGLTGPYDENGQIDLENNLSVYYTNLQYEVDPKVLLPELLENIEK